MADSIVFTPITPTEPVPTAPGSPMIYEQGERTIQLLTDIKQLNLPLNDSLTGLKDTVTTKLDSALQILSDIKDNTVPVAYDPSNPSGITFEQANDIIQGLHQINEVIAYGGAILFLYFVVKWLFRFFGGTIFGGL